MIKKIRTLVKYLKELIPLEKDFKDYDSYWKSRGFNAPSLERAKIISQYLKKGKKILDVGCGDGTMMEYLQQNNEPRKIIGIDISSYAVEYVRRKGYDAQVMDASSEEFENFLESHNFDYIIITEVLEHLQEPEKIIKNIKKHCPGAILFISIPNTGFIMHRLRLLFGKFPIVIIAEDIKEHIRFWTFSDFKYWCNFFGYKIKNYHSCAGSTKILGIDLGKIYPSLFATQIIFELKLKEDKNE